MQVCVHALGVPLDILLQHDSFSRRDAVEDAEVHTLRDWLRRPVLDMVLRVLLLQLLLHAGEVVPVHSPAGLKPVLGLCKLDPLPLPTSAQHCEQCSRACACAQCQDMSGPAPNDMMKGKSCMGAQTLCLGHGQPSI